MNICIRLNIGNRKSCQIREKASRENALRTQKSHEQERIGIHKGILTDKGLISTGLDKLPMDKGVVRPKNGQK